MAVKTITLCKKDKELGKHIEQYVYDPLGFVMFAYPWTEKDTALEYCKLENWQYQLLKKLGDDIRERGVFTGEKAVNPMLAGAVTGHGVGKSALLGMLCSWLMSTRPHCKGTITAGKYDQLTSKTWPELTNWMKLSITGHWFDYTAEKIQYVGEALLGRDDWRLDLQTCSESNSGSFAGQHARSSSSFYFFDEASEIPDKIWEVSEGGQTDGEPFHFIFGNCNLNKGRFYEASFGIARTHWNLFHVDSRQVSFTNKNNINKLIEMYGLESDYVRVRYLGLFPKRALNQYIGHDLVEIAQQRKIEQHEYHHLPRVLGVDPAGHGEDEHVIVMRQGYECWVLCALKHINYETMGLADKVAELEDKWETSATFIDQHGVGVGTIDRLTQLGRRPIMVNSQSADVKSPLEYQHKKDEMWGDMRKWLYTGGSIPANDTILAHDLTTPIGINDDRFIKVESKKAMRLRGESSPGRADALAYTFAAPVKTTAALEHYYRATGQLDNIGRFKKQKVKNEYDIWGSG